MSITPAIKRRMCSGAWDLSCVTFSCGKRSCEMMYAKKPAESESRIACKRIVSEINSPIPIPINIARDTSTLSVNALFVLYPACLRTKNSETSWRNSCTNSANAVPIPRSGETRNAGTRMRPSATLCIASPINTLRPDVWVLHSSSLWWWCIWGSAFTNKTASRYPEITPVSTYHIFSKRWYDSSVMKPAVKRKTPAENEIRYGRFLETNASCFFATNKTPANDARTINNPELSR